MLCRADFLAMTPIEQMEQRHALERKKREHPETPIQYRSDYKWYDWIASHFPSFAATYEWREKPAETSAEVVRPIWMSLSIEQRRRSHRQYRMNEGYFWQNIDDCDTGWNDDYQYRIVLLPPIPAPKYRPWTRDEAAMFVGRPMRLKKDGDVYAITSASETFAIIRGDRYLYAALLADFEQLDGAKCGVLEEGK